MKRNRKWKIPHMVLERRALCLSSYKNRKLKVKQISWSSRKKKEGIFCTAYFVRRKFFLHLCFMSMYSVLNTLSKYTYSYISKTLIHALFCLFLKTVESLQCILNEIKNLQSAKITQQNDISKKILKENNAERKVFS